MIRALVVLACGLAATLPARASIAAIQSETAAAWQQYRGKEATLTPAYRFPHASCFRAASSAHGLPETLLLAVARGESDFEATARSRANAHGVMQIQWPETARHLDIERLSDLYDPCTNIDAGARYLKELLGRYDGDLHLSLAAYNYGPSRIAQDAALIPAGAAWYSAYILRHLDFVTGNGENVPPVPSAYSEVGRSVLLSFAEPYRAAAFVERMEARAPRLQLDWFRKATGRFDVVLSYGDREEFTASARLLTRAGFPLH